jgi:hypothetical protein
MGPHDRLRALLGGVGCTACGAAVPADRIEVLAERESLAFVEFRCAACGSEALGLVVLEPDDDGALTPVSDVARYGEFGPADEVRLAGRPPIDGDDVAVMHAFLAAYQGDLRSLLGSDDARRGPA